jgi:hypothetical protein
MKFSEKELKNYLKLKNSIRLMKLRLVIAFVIVVCAFVSYFFSEGLALTFTAISLISLAEISLSSHTARLIEITEKLIYSDPDVLKLKANIH